MSLIWKEVEYNFVLWEKLEKKINWNQAQRFIRYFKTENLYEYYLELMKFFTLLGDGHTYVWFPKAIEDSPIYTSKLPIKTCFIDGKQVNKC